MLVPGVNTLRALVSEVPEPIDRLIGSHWPGGLTIVLPAQPSLAWDLGDTRGTVAVRMPAHRLAIELLEETGPLAVSSANLTGAPAAIVAKEAERMLRDSVAVYLDDGPATAGFASTIIDAIAPVDTITAYGATAPSTASGASQPAAPANPAASGDRRRNQDYRQHRD